MHVSANLDQREVSLALGSVSLEGTLTLPASARSVVVFAHGSGSGRRSPRNRSVAGFLAEAGLATLLIDLLTADEEQQDIRTASLRFDIDLLTERVVGAVDWLADSRHTSGLAIGCFGASTGAAAALRAAAARPQSVRALVSRGGRPDLAGDALEQVEAPTLLIVGGDDHPVIGLNEEAAERLAGPSRLVLVPGATHLFEEPGALDKVAELARDWFLTHLPNDEEEDVPFADRREAGRTLGAALSAYAGRPDTLVLGLARGGVPVAAEVARALDVPLDVFLVRKLGTPGHEELAMGAIASGGVQVLNDKVVSALDLDESAIEGVARREQAELERRESEYRHGRPPAQIKDRTVIVVDDGLATGASMRAAVLALRRQEAARIVVGVPVAAPSTCAEFEPDVDEIVCVRTPESFMAVGLWYQDFSQTSDEEVRELLESSRIDHPP